MSFFSDPECLRQVDADCWRLLEQAVHERQCGWRLPVLATVNQHQCRQRTVVLRGVDSSQRRILAHTDIRSGKIAAIRDNGRVSWLFYDLNRKVQLQLTGQATIHADDEVADRVWRQESESSLRGYLAPSRPGTVCRHPDVNLPPDMRDRIPRRDELSAARSNFSVISCDVSSAEWLLLRSIGNLRARFSYAADGTCSAEWLSA